MKKQKIKEYNHKEIESHWPRRDFPTSSAKPSDSRNQRGKQDYDHKTIETKWQGIWEKRKLNQPDLKRAKKPFYNLMMYPYPSAEGLHVGNMYAFTGADIYGRFKRMNGMDVFEPIGFDSGGIHSENFAIKMGIHPREMVEKNVATFTRQLKKIGAMYDWVHTVDAMDPNYYKWTQWIFVQLFKAGLAYKKEAPVIWCPSCKTTLSDEQTEKRQVASDLPADATALQAGKQQAATPEDGQATPEDGQASSKKLELEACNLELETITVCERCKTPIERRKMEQWFFKITDYAERLLKNTEKLNWTEKVLTAQRNWIGRSEGAEIKFQAASSKRQEIKVFTTRSDTLHGCTFLCLAPEHPLVDQITTKENKKAVSNYRGSALVKNEQQRKLDEKDKNGVFTGGYVINPVNNEKVPVWVADYVLMDYGGGAVMGVPGHDRRDWEFAKKYNLPIKVVIKPYPSRHPDPLVGGERKDASLDSSSFDKLRAQNDKNEVCYEGPGVLVNSGPWDGWRYPENMDRVIKWLEKHKCGRKATTYKLRDWCISRQRYWGPPIPMVFCRTCAEKGRSYSSTKSGGRMEKFSTGSNNRDNNMVGWYSVPEEDLPVLLPDIDDYLPASSAGRPDGSGRVPLARHPEFYKTKCPHCGGEAVRETDVSDTFLDSSWYYLRYPSARIKNSKCKMKNYNSKLKKTEIKEVSVPWDEEITKKWLPVDQYTGGAEHSVLHLMYSRFITMALHDMGYLDFSTKGGLADEPFPNFYAHGLIIKDGAKMSKSRGNVVNPDEYIEKYGTDALRSYLMFIGPFNQGGDFRDTGMKGMYKFVRKIYRLAMETVESCQQQVASDKQQATSCKRQENKTCNLKLEACIYKIGKDISRFKYNTAIAKLMEFVTFWDKNIDKTGPDLAERVAIVIAPLMPYLAEEIWQMANGKWQMANGRKEDKNHKPLAIGHKLGWSVHQQRWPKVDELKTRGEMVTVIVQVNGKLREKLQVASNKLEDEDLLVKEARDSEKVKRYLIGKTIKKTIFIPGKLVNFVV